MAISVNQIIREAIQTIKERGLILTPDNYAEVFCDIAKRNGVTLQDCQKLEKYIARLSDDFQDQLKQKNVRTVDELFAFMASRLNSPAMVDHSKLVGALATMSKRILQSISVLHDKNAKELSESSMDALNRRLDVATVEKIKDKWFDFLTDYDDGFLKRLSRYGVKNFDDLQTIVDELDSWVPKESDSEQVYEKIAPLIAMMLEPSITDQIGNEVRKITKILKSDPTLLAGSQTREDIQNLTKKRIELDKAEILNKVGALDKVLDGINNQVVSLISSSSKSSSEMQFIKNDLSSINLNEDSFEGIRSKMLNIADTLDGEVKQLGDQMVGDQETIKELQEKISKLEVELESAKSQSKEDFLTKTGTKKALIEELEQMEQKYNRYDSDYSVCFFDIDHFKLINDTYGHEAGDVVLAAIGKMLRKYSRQVDFVGRYGGEEFVILLPETTLADAIKFADKMREIVQNSKFMYKGERIDVTASCGVAIRSENTGSSVTIEEADKMLYQAKQGGRNKVMPELYNEC